MRDDTVDNFLGREAQWAMLCAWDGIEAAGPPNPIPSEAETYVDAVWEFVEFSCSEAGQPVPDRAEVMNAIMDALSAHSTMSKQALDSERVREGLKDILMGPGKLYEGLRDKGAGSTAEASS